MHYNTVCANGEMGKACLFNNYMESVYTKNTSHSASSACSIPTNVLQDVTLSLDEIFTALSSLNITKAAGTDGICPTMLRDNDLALYLPFHQLFTQCVSQHSFPSKWKVHRIAAIFKSGGRASIRNYRPISLQTYITTDLYHYRPISLQTYITTDLYHYRPISLQTYITTDLYHNRPISLQTYITTDLYHYRPISLQTYITTDLYHYLV